MKIGVLVADGVFDVGLAALLDTLGVANQLSASPLFVPMSRISTGEWGWHSTG